MKKIKYISLFLLCPFLMAVGTSVGDTMTEEINDEGSTQIVLDSIGNTVYLAYDNGYPSYYFAHIFTPVCNTGECLPVYVNIYWNLAGQYLRFDQPEGQILTKLDHVPFTPEDYQLLDEILRGSDPRYGELAHPNPGSQGDHAQKENNSNQSNPAPAMQNKKMISKYDMVDGITGATAIQHKAQFVPGALYTTYTLWGLANDHRQKISDYTSVNFFKPAYYNYFLSHNEWSTFSLLLEHLYREKTEPEARVNTQMAIIDSCSVDRVKLNVLYYVQYNDFKTDTVCHTLERTFFRLCSNDLRRQILSNWAYNYIPDSTLIRLSKCIYQYPDIFFEVTRVFSAKEFWPAGVLENLITCMGDLTSQNRKDLMAIFEARRTSFSKAELSKIKAAKKKYKL